MKNNIKIIFLFISVMNLVSSCSNEVNSSEIHDVEVSRPVSPILADKVRIGNQIWMTKNLNVSYYRNGDPIPQVQDPNEWSNLQTGAWCYYNNNSANGIIYGKLYNWYAVNDPRGLAPIGWHVPSNPEWTTLTNYLGGWQTAGAQLKSESYWNSPNTGANNLSGFSALPSGWRNADFATPIFELVQYYGIWWSSSETSSGGSYAYIRSLSYSNTRVNESNCSSRFGLSVRCIKD